MEVAHGANSSQACPASRSAYHSLGATHCSGATNCPRERRRSGRLGPVLQISIVFGSAQLAPDLNYLVVIFIEGQKYPKDVDIPCAIGQSHWDKMNGTNGTNGTNGVVASYVGAIDQGTTSSRFLIFNDHGEVVITHQLEFTQMYPQPGYAVLDATLVHGWETNQMTFSDGMSMILRRLSPR